MTSKEFDSLSKKLMKNKVKHLLIAQTDENVSLSCIATGDDIYEFLQAMVDTDDNFLEIMQAVVRSRNGRKERKEKTYLN